MTNVANFGAFVDIGVHQDGLIHLSELSNRYIRDPKEAVKVGEVVKVKVLSVDVPMKRISLSIKALLAPEAGAKKLERKEIQKPAAPKTMNDQLAALKAKFGGGKRRKDERFSQTITGTASEAYKTGCPFCRSHPNFLKLRCRKDN